MANWIDLTKIRSYKEFEDYLRRNHMTVDDINAYDWGRLTNAGIFNSVELAKKYKNRLYSEEFSMGKLSENLIIQLEKECPEVLNWYSLSLFQKLSYDFIKSHKNKLAMDAIMKNESIRESEDFAKIEEIYESMKDNKERQKYWYDLKQKTFLFRERNQNQNTKSIERTPAKPKVEKKVKDPVSIPKVKKETEDISALNKTQLKERLQALSVRVYYHDTIPILREKLTKALKEKAEKETKKNGNIQRRKNKI